MQDVNFQYTPRPYFLPFHQRDKRFACIVAHRRAGKTVACIHELILRALYTTKKNARYAYVAPYYRQAKDVAWVYLKDATRDFAIEIRESELRVKLPNNIWITLYGADNPDALRGIYLDGVVIDEIADCRPTLWGEVLLPTLMDRTGWAVFIGTVRGKNHFFHLYENALVDQAWYALMLRPDDTNIIPEEELRQMKIQMTEAQYEQEMNCNFTAAVGGTYYADLIQQLEARGNINETSPYNPEKQVYASADLGYRDSTAFWFWQEYGGASPLKGTIWQPHAEREDGAPSPSIRIIDYEEHQGKAVDFYVDLLNSKPFQIEELWLPHDAKAHTLQTGRSTLEQFQQAGFNCLAVPKLIVQQGIDAARAILPHCEFYQPATHVGIEALRAYKREYNPITKVYRDKPLHDWASDGADAFRYMALVARQKQSATIATKPAQLSNEIVRYTLDQLYDKSNQAPTLSISRRRI